MRDWQKSIAEEIAPLPTASDAALSETKTPSVPPQIMWSAVTTLLVFAVLATVRPPFVESGEREKALEPRRTNWALVTVVAVASGAVVLVLSSI
jgi:hypothetical protein